MGDVHDVHLCILKIILLETYPHGHDNVGVGTGSLGPLMRIAATLLMKDVVVFDRWSRTNKTQEGTKEKKGMGPHDRLCTITNVSGHG